MSAGPATTKLYGEELEPSDVAAVASKSPTSYFGGKIGVTSLALRVRDSTGRVVGTIISAKPAIGMNTIAMLTATGDLDHMHRMRGLAAAVAVLIVNGALFYGVTRVLVRLVAK